MSFKELLKEVESYHPNPNVDVLKKAFDYASEKHASQLRASGEPYFVHLESTAKLVAQLKLDVSSVVAALLHDVIEDCNVTREELQAIFGPDIVNIVEGVTNLTRLKFQSKEENQAESFRKMLLAMSKDIRVVLVKLCDRLHNMRTLEYVTAEKQRRKALEVKEIYAPLANRLGIHWLKSELEDLCFKYLRPALYESISEKLADSETSREEYIKLTANEIVRTLEEAGVSAAVTGRSKHYFSIWNKMERQNLTFEEVHDLIGFRIIVPTLRSCYEGLGIIHAKWKPAPGRFKDYIAMPKPNMYQSLHTTVIGPKGHRIEVQIRTPEMNRVAEEGIAAHWKYKEGEKNAGFDLQWVKELVETQEFIKNPDEFIQSVKGELFPDEIFVFTPKGDLITLPFKSTPVDFAYAIHSDLGDTITGAKVNGKIVPFSATLDNGDTIEIVVNKNSVPNKDWLQFVKTNRAKQRIRNFIKSKERKKAENIGVEILKKDLRKVKRSFSKIEKQGELERISQELGFKLKEDMYAAISYGKLSTTRVLAKVLPDSNNIEDKLKKKETPLRRIFRRAAKATRQKVGVSVSGVNNMVVRFARCCEPLPGDRIVGFITRGRGITIHLADCQQVHGMDHRRFVDVSWDDNTQQLRRVKIIVHCQDQKGILAQITQGVSENGGDIKSAEIKTSEFGKAKINLELEIQDSEQFKKVVRSIEMVSGIIKVERVHDV